MTIVWWHDRTLLWETLLLGGEVMPGVAAVQCDVERKLDIQSLKGGDGATISDEGYIPSPVQIALKLWLREQWMDWLRLLPTIHPRTKGGVRSPLEIQHPATDALGIQTIYVRKIGSPRGEGGGERTITLDAIEWFPAPKPIKKTTASKKPKVGAVNAADFDVPTPSGGGAPALNI